MWKLGFRPCWIVTAFLLGAACSNDNPGGTGGLCRTGTYQLNPNIGMAYTLTEDYRFLCRDSAFEPVRFFYDDCSAESNGFLWFDGGGVDGLFQASLGEYVFTGSIVREFANGVGPFVEGTYERKSGGTTLEIGQFAFTEGELEPPGTIECTPRSSSAAGKGPAEDH